MLTAPRVECCSVRHSGVASVAVSCTEITPIIYDGSKLRLPFQGIIDFCTVIVVNNQVNILELDSTLGMSVIRRFLGRPGSIGRNMLNIIRLTLCLHHPGRNRGISDGSLVKVEDQFSTTFKLQHYYTPFFWFVNPFFSSPFRSRTRISMFEALRVIRYTKEP